MTKPTKSKTLSALKSSLLAEFDDMFLVSGNRADAIAWLSHALDTVAEKTAEAVKTSPVSTEGRCNHSELSPKCGDSVEVTRSLFQEGDGGAIPTSPLQLEIETIKAQFACELNEKWHSRLPKIHWSNVVHNTHYICFGAKYDYRWYAVGIWSSPVEQNRFRDGKKMLELRIMAICEASPQNTATRMIAVMVSLIKKKFPEITRLISYQDTEVHRGTIYKASNWKMGR